MLSGNDALMINDALSSTGPRNSYTHQPSLAAAAAASAASLSRSMSSVKVNVKVNVNTLQWHEFPHCRGQCQDPCQGQRQGQRQRLCNGMNFLKQNQAMVHPPLSYPRHIA